MVFAFAKDLAVSHSASKQFCLFKKKKKDLSTLDLKY